MAKSTNGTKKLNEALTPDQVSKVEDKYKSIYSGMLKGNKKKLMKYIDPKLKRPNPDAMAMGRAINLVKKETETINEGLPPGYGKFLVSLQMLITDIAPNAWGNKSQIRRGDVKRIHNSLKKRYGGEYEKFNNLLKNQSGTLGDWYLEEPLNEAADPKVLSAIETIEKVKAGPKRKEAMAIVLDAAYKKTGEKARTYKQALQFLDLEEPINETLKLGVKYQLPTGETGYIMTGGSDDPRDWKFSGNKRPYLSVEDKLTPLEKQPGKYDGAFDMGHGKGHHIDEELVNEDNSYDSFKTDATERFLNRSQVVELLPVLKNSLNKLNFSPSKQPTLSVKRYGLSSSNKGYVISMYIPTSKDDIIVELGKYPKDDKTDEVSISLYLPNEEGRLTQVAYETSTLPKGEELAEDSNVLSKVISMANQWYEKPNTIDERLTDEESVNENNSYIRVSEPRFVKDKNNPNFLNVYMDYDIGSGGSSIALGKETMTGQIRRQSAAEAMKQMNDIANELEAKHNIEDIEVVDMENGKVRLFAVSDDFNDMVFESSNERLSAMVKEVYSEKQRKWACAQDGPEFDEMCKDTAISKKKLKETTMKNDRLTELIKSALTGPVQEESTPIKEGIWSMGTVTQIQDFLRDLNRLKDKYYNIVGSDDVFDGLDRAERSAEEMMMNAPENRHDLDEDINEELATTPIKDDIYAIGSRIYKDPYEAISLVATDQTVVVRDFARKDKKFKAAVMDYVKSKGLETSVDRDGLYIDTKPLDFKGMPLMNEKSLAESIFKKLRG